MGFSCVTDFNGKVFTAQDHNLKVSKSYTTWNILKPYHITGVDISLYFH